MPWVKGMRGVLVDVDGTLLDGARAVPGAAEFLARLRAAGLPFRIATNTSRRSRAAVARALREVGLDVVEDDVVLPATIARRAIEDSGRAGAMLLVPDEARRDFAGLDVEPERPDWVVVGDLGAGFTFERLDAAFRALASGARLIALHKNRFWHPGDGRGPTLDAGPFVAALEYAAGVEATVVGKPSPEFFEIARRMLGTPPEATLAIGDSVDNDGLGPARAGLRVALVRGAAYREERLRASGLTPDLVVDSVADLAPRGI